jgi:uncharacterized protein YxeA
MSVPKPKKMVSRSVAIALGIICIVLIAGIGGVMAYYTGQINDKNATINDETNTYNNYVNDHHHTDEDYNSLQSQYNSEVQLYNSEVQQYNAYLADHHHTDEDYNSVNNIVSLTDSTVWVNDQTLNEPASSYVDWTPKFTATYCGYVVVSVQTSTTSNTYVRVIYSAYGVSYDHQIGVGTGGTAVFPILPSSSIDIRIGNSNLLNGATETVTITYYY